MTLGESQLQPAATQPYKYRAFISYSHTDKAWGDWLHKALERYRVPGKLVGTLTSAGPVPRRIHPVFKDREELPSSADLGEQIDAALRRSGFLVVICSPRAARSRWVNEEILSFKRLGGANRILPIIVDGEPNAADKPNLDPALECLPPALRFVVDESGRITEARTQPVCADARAAADGRNNALLKLIAGTLGVGFDALKQREAVARRRRFWIRSAIGAAASIALLGGLTVLTVQWQSAAQQRSDALARLAEHAADAGDMPRSARYALAGTIGSARSLVGFDDSRSVVALRRAAALISDPVIIRYDGLGPVFSVAYAPDGDKVAAGSQDGAVRILEAHSGRVIHLLGGHKAGVQKVVFSPDGTRLASVAADGTALLWDVEAGKLLFELVSGAAAESDMVDIAFAPDGRSLVVAVGTSARVWNAESGALATILAGHDATITSAAFSPDSRRIVTASADTTGRIWDAVTGATLAVLRGHTGEVAGARFTRDGSSIATISYDGNARLWNAADGASVAVLEGDGEPLYTMALSPDASTLAVNGDSGIVALWSMADHRRHSQLFVGPPLTSMEFIADGARLATASSNGTAEIFDTQSGDQLVSYGTPGEDIYLSMAVAPDGSRMIVGAASQIVRLVTEDDPDPSDDDDISKGGSIFFWSTRTVLQGDLGRWSDNAYEGSKAIRIAYAPGDEVLATAGWAGEVRLWNARTGALIKSFEGHDTSEYVRALAISADGSRIASGSTSGKAYLWDLATGDRLASFPDYRSDNSSAQIPFSPDSGLLAAPGRAAIHVVDARMGTDVASIPIDTVAALTITIAFSADSKQLAVGTSERAIRIFDVHTATQIALIPLPQGDGWVYALAFSADGRRLAGGSSDGQIWLWDSETFQPVADLAPFKGRVRDMVFSPGSERLAAASDDGTARVWETESGLEKAILRGHTDQVWKIRFVGDDHRVATLSWDGTLRIWDVESESELFDHVVATDLSDDRGAAPGVSGAMRVLSTMDLAFSADGTRFVTVFPNSQDQRWATPPSLTDPDAKLKVTICEDLLRGDLSRFADEDLRSAPFLNPGIDHDPCHPPSLWPQIVARIGL